MAASMEELAASLDAHLDVAQNPYDTNRPHPRFADFSELREKSKEMGDQNKRRQEFLERQKSKRETVLNASRKLGELESFDKQIKDIDMKEDDTTSVKKEKFKPYKLGKYNFSNQLMLSEWLVDLPPNLAEDWVVKPIPKGRRMLVVAKGGTTKAYCKSGQLVAWFSSLLPGGSTPTSEHSITMLDCIWCREHRTYYVLDTLAWNRLCLLNYDTEFRFFWLQSKLGEMSDVQKHLEQNKFPFLPIPYYESKPEILTEVMARFPMFPGGPGLDGILFYNKLAIYEHGVTPLVTWLKPFMLEDVLQVKVAQEYLNERPEGYQSQGQYIQEFEDNLNKRKDYWRTRAQKQRGRPLKDHRHTNDKQKIRDVEMTEN